MTLGDPDDAHLPREGDVRRDIEVAQRQFSSYMAAFRTSPLPELSMGMSSDYWAAVAEGATMIRLGTILFGERPT